LVTISRREVEERVLVALRDKLMRRDLFEDFCQEYLRELNRLRMELRADSRAAAPRSPLSTGRSASSFKPSRPAFPHGRSRTNSFRSRPGKTSAIAA
jgi:hypothetical protein